MNTRLAFAPFSRCSLAALLLASLAPVGCVAGPEETEEVVGVDDDAITSGAIYSIKGVQSGKCVGVSSAGKNDGANVDQSTCDGSSDQAWKFSDLGNSVFKIAVQHSGKCLDIKYDATTNGANVQQMGCDGAADQKWKVTSLGNGEYKLVAEHSGKCMDVEDGSRTNGGNIQQWACSGGENQRFKLARVGATPPPASGSPLANRTFFVDDQNTATRMAKLARDQHDDYKAGLIEKISTHAQGVWFGNWNDNIKDDVSDVVRRSGSTVPILVPYNIPGRDCGSYSGGGAAGTAAYKTWIDELAAGIGSAEVVVILEPDALWMTVAEKCAAVKDNLSTLKYAVQSLKQKANAHVYIDAGMAGTPSAIAAGLSQAGVYEADGFALNVSDSYDNASSAARGRDISDHLNGKVRFVIDTSRNGTGRGKDQSISDPWCNPKGLGLGKISTGNTGMDRVDAFLWIKRAGQSDGDCNRNNPPAGAWFETRALEMARNAVF